jgi:hypothetical protein
LWIRSSNLKPQDPTIAQQLKRKATTCLEYQQEVFYLQDELAEVICARLQEKFTALLMADSSECKGGSKLPIVPTPSRETQACAVLSCSTQTNVRILQASKNLRDIENFP